MALPKSPFANSSSSPGFGDIKLSLLPPGRQVLTSLTYQYPLKLVAPDPHHAHEDKHVTVVFLLTYGGGLIGGDQIQLKMELEDLTRLVLVTQGSTKLFKAPSRDILSRQVLDVKVGKGSSLCYLPDPTQPFAESVYEQRQTFYVEPDGSSSLLVLDWVSEGRKARGESWTLWQWKGRNEVRAFEETGRGKLLLRDAVTLVDGALGGVGLNEKTNDLGIFGTLIVYGSTFRPVGDFFLQRFTGQPRIGAKHWDLEERPVTAAFSAMESALLQEQRDGVLWTAANVRGFVLVKFGARELDGARRWLGTLLRQEGTVDKHFGRQALIGLR